MRQASEPSVEEILESIKKVIARDNRADAARERSRRENMAEAPRETARTAAPRRDVLDLTEIAAHILQEDLSPDLQDQASDDRDDSAPLLAEETTTSMRDSLAALAMLSAPGAAPQIVRSGETSLEGLVREMLRPQLAEWLDRHLPPMVEKLVATEIARIVGKKG